ncbi:DUF58 domain-containing protein [Sulfurimonas sp. MAG313]|nr:DUF58 domain-containing protein [Sulfurimonas sp. MAG313]MDF1880717.1 DUF58 domain-containing protein [Sulfurimonas sp. MAG313]
MFKTLSNKPLARMLIKAQKEVFSKIVGDNNSKNKGSGYDFVELREYESGDDIKHIDWIISSKMQKPHVKIFHQQRELNVVICPILTGSLHFGTKILKREVLNEACALISYSCVRQNDPFESLIGNEDVVLNGKRSKDLFAVRRLAEKIASYEVLGRSAHWKKISSRLYTLLRKKSLVFLVGDFFDTKELDLGAFSMKHEVIIIIIRDRFEEDPALLAKINITDPNTKESAFININTKALKTIKKKILQEDQELYQKLHKLGIRFVKIYTDENPAEKIFPLLRSA